MTETATRRDHYKICISYENRTGLKLCVLPPINFIACGSFCLTTTHPLVHTLRTQFQIDFFFARVIGSEAISSAADKKQNLSIYSIMSSSFHFLTLMYKCMRAHPDRLRHQHKVTHRCRTFFPLYRYTSTQFADSRFSFCSFESNTGMRERVRSLE